MLKIKLFPRGKKHQRTFRIVVAEARSKSNGNFVADLGFFTPQTKTLNIDKEKLDQWIKNGAKLSFGVDRLLNPEKFPKKAKVKTPKVVKEPVAKTTEETIVEPAPVETIPDTSSAPAA